MGMASGKHHIMSWQGLLAVHLDCPEMKHELHGSSQGIHMSYELQTPHGEALFGKHCQCILLIMQELVQYRMKAMTCDELQGCNSKAELTTLPGVSC